MHAQAGNFGNGGQALVWTGAQGRTGVRGCAGPAVSVRSAECMPEIFVPKWKTVPISFERELRTGGLLHEKLRRERGDTRQRLARAALPHRNYQRPRGSEWNLQAVVDA